MKYLIFFIILFTVAGCEIVQPSIAPPIQIDKDTQITKHYFETGGLYNRNYEIMIRGSGEVFLKGNFGLKKPVFEKQWNIPPEDVAKLVETFRKNNFFEFGDKYGSDAMDVTEISLGIFTDGKEKNVTRLSHDKHTKEEEILRKLELMVNKTANAEPSLRECCYFDNYPPESIP